MEETSQQRIVDDGANMVPFAWAADTNKGQKVRIFKTLLSKKSHNDKNVEGLTANRAWYRCSLDFILKQEVQRLERKIPKNIAPSSVVAYKKAVYKVRVAERKPQQPQVSFHHRSQISKVFQN